jgi:hypothetical protein
LEVFQGAGHHGLTDSAPRRYGRIVLDFRTQARQM